LHGDELRDFYSSLSVIKAIKSRSMRRAGQVAFMGDTRKYYRILVLKHDDMDVEV